MAFLFALSGFFGVGFSAQANRQAPLVNDQSFSSSLLQFEDALDSVNLALMDNDDLCTSAIPNLTQHIRDLKLTLPEITIEDEDTILTMRSLVEKLLKISEILANICESKSNQTEVLTLVNQLTLHFNTLNRIYSEASGASAHETEMKPVVTYVQWKLQMRTLMDQVKSRTAETDWDRLERLGEAIHKVSVSEMPNSSLRHIKRLDREKVQYDRERLALYGTILKEYASEENLPHVLYFSEKIKAIVAAMP